MTKKSTIFLQKVVFLPQKNDLSINIFENRFVSEAIFYWNFNNLTLLSRCPVVCCITTVYFTIYLSIFIGKYFLQEFKWKLVSHRNFRHSNSKKKHVRTQSNRWNGNLARVQLFKISSLRIEFNKFTNQIFISRPISLLLRVLIHFYLK